MTRYTPKQARSTTAYKGYLITADFLSVCFYISKDGHHIGSAASYDLAKQSIDELTA